MSQYYRYYVELVEGGTQVKITAYDPSHKTLNEPGGRCDLATVPPDIQRLVDKIRRNTARPAEMDKLGEALFKALFPPGVTTHLRDLLDKVGQKEAILRLELDLNKDDLPAIAALPWEFLRAPETSGRAVDNLGTHPKVVLSRRRALWDVAQPISLDEPLRIQLVVSAPTDEDPVEYEDVFTALQGLAQDHPDQVAPPLEILHQPQLSTLEAALETHHPHILHFIGHGQLRKARGVEFGELALVKPDGRANWRTDEEIGEVFQVFSPLVVFLQACNSGAEGRAGAFVGVASQVVQRNVPVVVAMQYPVSNHVAGIFAKAFYERLSTFTPVDMAVQRGRRLLRQEFKKTRDFATPLIFMRVKDGTLFVPPKPAEPEEETALEPDAALARRFTPIWLEEPAINDAIDIVRAVASGHLAAHHQIGFVPEAIEAAVRLSARYLHDERLPGKAINPLDEAALFTIFERELRPFQKKLQQESGVTVTVPDEMKYQIVRHIVQQKLGARPLRRFIEDKVIAPIVDKLLSDDIKPGTQITLGSELEIDNVAPPPVSPLGGQPPPAFDPGQLDLGGVGAPAPPSLQPQRPAKPEDGLPHHDGLPDEEQTEFDECFLALARQLAQKNIALEIERLAKYFLCAPGAAADQKPREGRSIKQAFDELIEQPLTDQLLAEEFKDGDRIKLDYSADGPVIKKMEEQQFPLWKKGGKVLRLRYDRKAICLKSIIV